MFISCTVLSKHSCAFFNSGGSEGRVAGFGVGSLGVALGAEEIRTCDESQR